MNEEGVVEEVKMPIEAGIDAGGPNLGGLFQAGDNVEIHARNLRFTVVNAAGALLTLKFEGFIRMEEVGGAA